MLVLESIYYDKCGLPEYQICIFREHPKFQPSLWPCAKRVQVQHVDLRLGELLVQPISATLLMILNISTTYTSDPDKSGPDVELAGP